MRVQAFWSLISVRVLALEATCRADDQTGVLTCVNGSRLLPWKPVLGKHWSETNRCAQRCVAVFDVTFQGNTLKEGKIAKKLWHLHTNYFVAKNNEDILTSLH